jgi:YgiT-type zinc finger domain-containing protein
VNHEEKRNGRLYLFTHVPAKVCAACGEVWIDEPTLREIDRLIRTGKPTRKVETPVYDLAVGASSR